MLECRLETQSFVGGENMTVVWYCQFHVRNKPSAYEINILLTSHTTFGEECWSCTLNEIRDRQDDRPCRYRHLQMNILLQLDHFSAARYAKTDRSSLVDSRLAGRMDRWSAYVEAAGRMRRG